MPVSASPPAWRFWPTPSKADLARGYVVVALPSVTILDLLARFALRKRLHKRRQLGSCMRKVVIVGHTHVVADLVAVLRRETYHGLQVVAACVTGGGESAGDRRAAGDPGPERRRRRCRAASVPTPSPCSPARR